MRNLIAIVTLLSVAMFLSLSAQSSPLSVQADSASLCNSPEYRHLEDQFLDLAPAKKQRFFALDKLCMLELGLDKDDIVDRRTIFLMGSMNYEQYGELD